MTTNQTPKTFQDMDTKVGDMLTCVTSIEGRIFTIGKSYEVLRDGLNDDWGVDSSCNYTSSTFVQATPAIDYNNGKWHGWTGGIIPVHHRTQIHYTLSSGYTSVVGRGAGGLNWDYKRRDIDDGIVAFRVSKEYVETPTLEIKEPLEFWFFNGNRSEGYHKLKW